MLIISGAFGCFKKEVLVKAGGYLTNCIGEDMEIVVRVHEIIRKNKFQSRITFVPDPVCWTEAPESIRVLKSQRICWQKGTLQSLGLHKNFFMNPQVWMYGWVGLLAFPYFAIFEMLGPIIEFIGYAIFILSCFMGMIDYPFAALFLTVAILYGVILSVLSVILEEISFRKYPKTRHLLTLFCASILENFGYRQLTTWWRFQGIIEYLFGAKTWGKIEKKGFKI